jgi:hypothetical protein
MAARALAAINELERDARDMASDQRAFNRRVLIELDAHSESGVEALSRIPKRLVAPFGSV